MVSPVSFSKPNLSWGHGLVLTKINGYMAVGHTGTGYGSRAISYAFPELGWVFSATFNSRDVNREEFLSEVMNILIDEGVVRKLSSLPSETKRILSEIQSFQDNTILPVKEEFEVVPFADGVNHLKEYAGVYNSEITGKQVIKISSNGKLVMWGDELIQDPSDKDLFRFPLTTHPYANAEPVRFLRNKDGKVASMNALYVLFIPKKQDGY